MSDQDDVTPQLKEELSQFDLEPDDLELLELELGRANPEHIFLHRRFWQWSEGQTLASQPW
jgi:hypothetical protein